MAKYARIIVDISQEKLDKTFEYRIPERLKHQITVGMQVHVPFGNRQIKGYVVELTDEVEYDEEKLKDILTIDKTSIPIESHRIGGMDATELWWNDESRAKDCYPDQREKEADRAQESPACRTSDGGEESARRI